MSWNKVSAVIIEFEDARDTVRFDIKDKLDIHLTGTIKNIKV